MKKNPWLLPAGEDGYIPAVVLFDRLAALYGEKWREQFRDDSAKTAWQEEAGRVLYERGIKFVLAKAALEKLRRSIQPDSVPVSVIEFAHLCLPDFDFEAAWHEAVKQSAMESLGMATWSNKMIYWAASSFGFTKIQQTPWARAKGEWVRILTGLLLTGCPEIPEKKEVVYSRGSMDVGLAALAGLKQKLGVVV